MKRSEAISKLKQLEGRDLHELAEEYEVTFLSSNGNVNKGWAGHVLERYLGLPVNSSQSPDFGSWELKSVSLKRLRNGYLAFKETMAITMIDEYNVKQTGFEESHLLAKLQKFVIVARIVGENSYAPTFIHSVTGVDLSDELYKVVREDYELVRECINDPNRGFSALTGEMGTYIQPRTKGPGHGSISRAFICQYNQI